jgi:hypothetical protein
LTTLEITPRVIGLPNASFDDNGISFDNKITALTTNQTLAFQLGYFMKFNDSFSNSQDLLISNPEKMKYIGIYLQATNFND